MEQNESTNATEQEAREAPAEEPAKPSRSKRQSFRHAVTTQTAKGLVLAKGALEAVARWLDAGAKSVGDLAARMRGRPQAESGPEPAPEASSA